MTKALAVAVTLAIAGCQSHDDRDNVSTDYSHLKLAPVSSARLTPATDTSRLATLLKNGVRLQLSNQHGLQTMGLAAVDTTDYSNANLHEPGVDEADRLQYDGDHLFVASIYDQVSGDTSKRIRILSTDPAQASATEVATLDFGSENVSISGLYLRRDDSSQTRELVALGSTLMFGPVDLFVTSGAYWNNGETRVELFDVANPAAATRLWSFSVEGLLLESRRIGDRLYLVSHSFPVITGLNFAASTDAEKLANERLIRNVDVRSLLPHYRIDNGSKQPLVNADDCLLPAETASNEGYANIVTLTVIDLASRQVTDSTCLSTPIQGLYATPRHLYLGGNDYRSGDSTVLHKFSFGEDRIDYQATGSVSGTLGWTDPGYRMSEHNDQLRLVTSTRQENNSLKHALHVLVDDGNGTLSTLASLPNAEHPEPIGKPGEDIFAVRFFADRGYVVSFQRVDPLYVIDLSNAADPFIAGALEVPGFSSYLHPIGADYLLSVGAVRADIGFETRVKVELFNVADMSAPFSAGSITLGEHSSFSEANYDSRALNFLRINNDTLRFTLPIQIEDTIPGYGPFYEWTWSGLQLFEVTGLEHSAQLRAAGQLVVDQRSVERLWPRASFGGRSRLHDNAVYHVYGNGVWSAFWQNPEQATGPH